MKYIVINYEIKLKIPTKNSLAINTNIFIFNESTLSQLSKEHKLINSQRNIELNA